MTTDIQKIQAEVTKELANKETLQALVATTFKGLQPENVKEAIVAGMIRGFSFKDFLEKNIYAIPYGKGYSLVTSIDYARKVGMRSGVVGKSEPVYEDKDGRIVACSVTIKRKVNPKDIGEFTAKVYFAEYTTGQNLWTKKPRTMIAKVAEMHALRMACPEELSQMYTVEEMGESKIIEVGKLEPIDIVSYEKKLKEAKTLEELKTAWSAVPFEAKSKLVAIKDEVKKNLK
jgi:hypothetical protein